MAAMASAKFTFKQFQTEYPNDRACLDKIMLMTYGGTHIKCPGCQKQVKFHRIEKRRAYACQGCGHHIYPCVGTVFEKSRTPLNKWFYAMYLFTSSRHGVPARELERQLGVTYKCAWRIAHELRKLMASADKSGPLSGHVEVDETYIGGRIKASKDKTGRSNKTTVLAIVEREGNVRAGPIPDVTKITLERAVKSNVEPGSRVSTDEWAGYRDLHLAGYDHQTVNHKRDEYVRGDVHTNTVEGYWSRLKNSIKGTHVHISEKHAWKYISEFSFRYNMRKRPAAMFDRMILAVSLPRLADA
jgi:transposase